MTPLEVYAHVCPFCRAAPNKWCRRKDGTPMQKYWDVHLARLHAARHEDT